MTTTSRFVDLAGCVNFRDLGGYATPDGITLPATLYRSDSLHRLGRSDHIALAELGVRWAIDLRSSDERRNSGEADLGQFVDIVHVPTIDTAMNAPLTRDTTRDLAHGYELLLDEAREQHGRALRHIARATDPLVFFCNAGKDRTGLVAALVLGLVGVDEEDIVSDYVLSHGVMDAVRARILDEQPELVDRWKVASEDILGAHAETMAQTLQSVHTRWGGFAGYADAAGLDAADIVALRERLIHRP